MRSWGFLLTRRWILFAAIVVLLAWAAWWLGEWQFHRLEDRKQTNAIIRANESASPVPPGRLMPPGEELAEADEWRPVTATGEYAADDTVLVRYRTRDGAPGADVVVPLVTDDGTALLVDRGWVPADDNRGTVSDVPPPPDGEVTVTGWARRDATGDETLVSDGSTRAISSDRIGEALDRELYGGFVDLRAEDPAPADAPVPAELPELNNGPHFFYGLQWWFFGVLAVFGFGYLAWDEWRKRPGAEGHDQDADDDQSARSMPPSTGSIAPVTKDAAGDSRNAAARPNSSGSP